MLRTMALNETIMPLNVRADGLIETDDEGFSEYVNLVLEDLRRTNPHATYEQALYEAGETMIPSLPSRNTPTEAQRALARQQRNADDDAIYRRALEIERTEKVSYADALRRVDNERRQAFHAQRSA